MFVYLLFCFFEEGMPLSSAEEEKLIRLVLLVEIADITAEQAYSNTPPTPPKGHPADSFGVAQPCQN